MVSTLAVSSVHGSTATPNASNSRLVSARDSMVRLVITTCAPRPARATAKPRPNPRLPPVTTATRPVRAKESDIRHLRRCGPSLGTQDYLEQSGFAPAQRVEPGLAIGEGHDPADQRPDLEPPSREEGQAGRVLAGTGGGSSDRQFLRDNGLEVLLDRRLDVADQRQVAARGCQIGRQP